MLNAPGVEESNLATLVGTVWDDYEGGCVLRRFDGSLILQDRACMPVWIGLLLKGMLFQLCTLGALCGFTLLLGVFELLVRLREDSLEKVRLAIFAMVVPSAIMLYCVVAILQAGFKFEMWL